MRFHFHLYFAVALAMTFDALSADHLDRFEARTFRDEGLTLPYRLLKPADYDRSKKYPLVVFLHGAGERGDDNAKQLKHGMGDFAADAAMKKHPAFVMAPQCPSGQKWVDVDWSAPSHTLPEKPSPALAATLNAIAALQNEFAIDPQRIYITGLSMGGYGVWDALARRPELFAAAIPICGGGDPAMAKQIMSVPLWAFHGAEDKSVPVHRSREMIEAIKATGGHPKYTEYPGVGHDSWTQTYSNPELHTWLFAQRKP
jgi:predicted peptidase